MASTFVFTIFTVYENLAKVRARWSSPVEIGSDWIQIGQFLDPCLSAFISKTGILIGSRPLSKVVELVIFYNYLIYAFA